MIDPHSSNDALLRKAVGQFIRERQGDFDSLFLQVHERQKRKNAVYGAYCATFAEALRWQDAPTLPLSAFRHTNVCTFPLENAVRTFRTSGTTGEGYGQHHFLDLDLYQNAAIKGWEIAGLPQDLPVYALIPDPGTATHSSLSCMAGWLTETDKFYFGQWGALEEALVKQNLPCVLFGTALAFIDFFEHLNDRRVALPHGSVAVETGGYKGTNRTLPKEALYTLFQNALGLARNDVWNEYGMTELSSQFYTRGLGNPHLGSSWIRARVIDPISGEEVQDGETGVLHIFDLANFDSCSAIQTRDLAVRRGDDFVLIGRDPTALPRGCSRAAEDFLKR